MIINNEVFKKERLFINVENFTNSRYYEQVIQELKERCDTCGEEYNFDVSEKQEKFKQCVGECRKAALTIKSASGIASFSENK